MWRQRRYGLAFAAAVTALAPCLGPLCFLGTPVGLWALLVLRRPEVRRGFARRAQAPLATE